MVVKEKRGRRRYVAYELGGPVAKSELEEGIRSTGYSQISVIQCAGGWCILRCEPWLLERLDGIMGKACPGSVSRSTSGNLITLRRKYPILWDTRPRYIAFTVSADQETLSEGMAERADADGPSLKFCGSGYAIVKCTLRDTARTKDIMSGIDPSSQAFLSSYKSKDLRKAIADRCPELRSVLLTRK